MDLNKVFSYQFEDKQWTNKLGIGAVISLVPILNFALSGYIVGIIRNVMDNSAEILPGWDDLGKKFSDGLILVGAGLIYALPLIIILLPIGIITASGLFSGNDNLQSIGHIFESVGNVLLYCFLCLIIIYALALSVVYPAILVMFARDGTFASCFKFREVFGIVSRNAGPFFTAWIVSFGGGVVVGLIVGFINLLVGWIPCFGWVVSLATSLASTMYIVTVYAYLFGQFGLVAFGKNQPVG